MKNNYLALQPIINRAHEIVAYELLFRSGQVAIANIEDDLIASANVITDALSTFGLEQLLGDKLGFVNVSQSLLMSKMIELLPKDRVVLELLETIPVNEETIERCHHLSQLGYKLALDDLAFPEQFKEIFPYVSYAKLDILNLDRKKVSEIINQLLLHQHIKLLAEKIETLEQYEWCRQLGFTLFQGYYFAHPRTVEHKRIDPVRSALFQLLEQIHSNDSVREVEETFQLHPELTVKLLRLVKSVGIGGRIEIDSIRQALTVLGQKRLQSWVQLLLYAVNSEAHAGPLMILAAKRGKFMELLAKPGEADLTDIGGAAYMVGVLSLVDVLLGMTMEDLLGQIILSTQVKSALLERDGYLGSLLKLTIAIEEAAFEQYEKLLTELHIQADEAIHAQLEATRWSEKLRIA